jgi:hypothetical protein
MSCYLITDEELELLREMPWAAQLIYLRAIRPYMDYSTGIVGLRRGISRQSIAEELSVPGQQGRHNARRVVPSTKEVRHGLDLLKKEGLIAQIPADKKLVFRLPHAQMDQSVQNMRGRRGAEKRGQSGAEEISKLINTEEYITPAMKGHANTPMRGRHPVSGKTTKKPYTEANASVSAEPEQTRKLSQAEPPRQAPLLPPVALTNNPPPRKPALKAAKQRISTVPVWTAYATAYRERYGVDPVRNSTVNGQLAHLVRRLGDEAPDVARYYLDLEDRLYRREGHSVGMLLKHCEHLRTLWIRARKTNPDGEISADEVVVAL